MHTFFMELFEEKFPLILIKILFHFFKLIIKQMLNWIIHYFQLNDIKILKNKILSLLIYTEYKIFNLKKL